MEEEGVTAPDGGNEGRKEKGSQEVSTEGNGGGSEVGRERDMPPLLSANETEEDRSATPVTMSVANETEGDKPLMPPLTEADKMEEEKLDMLSLLEANKTEENKTGTSPHQAADKTNASPHQVADKTGASPHQAADKTGASLHQAADKIDASPHQAADKTGASPHQAADKTGTSPYQAVEKTGASPHQAVDKTGASPHQAVDKTGASPHQAVDKTGTSPHQAADKTGALPHQAADKTEEDKEGMPLLQSADKIEEDIPQMPPLLPASKTEKDKPGMPPLLGTNKTKNNIAMSPNPVQSMVLKVISGASPPAKLGTLPSLAPAPFHIPIPSPTNTSHMRLVQTADGKKYLLTNVVNVSRPTPNKPVILLSKGQGSAASTAASSALFASSAPLVTPVVSSNMPQTIILNPSQPQAPQPVVLRVPGINQPIVVRQQCTNPKATTCQPSTAPQSPTTAPWRAAAATTTTTAAVAGPITSPVRAVTPKGPIMFVQNGTTTFKVVGKPVPVKLFPRVQRIAPKSTSATTAPPVPLPLLENLRKAPESASHLVIVPPCPPKAPLPEPPAYLNIRVKEEPQEQEGVSDTTATVKTEPVEAEEEGGMDEGTDIPLHMDAMLDVRIKEEATDEQSELLARDEQLREVLGVTDTLSIDQQQEQKHQQQQSPQQPQLARFYIRTTEGKLVSISPEEAKSLGLNHNDRVVDNQRRLMRALSSAQTAVLHRTVGAEMAAKLRPETSTIIIPGNVDIKDFVSRHVSPAAEKTAALMRNLAGRRLGTNANAVLSPKSNTAIIGEFEGDDGRRYLKITIETEANGKEPCNVPITPLNTYQCPFCARDFKTKDHVVSHIRIHTGERPYPCDVCGKRYRQRIDIIRHMRIHTGEKPFNCGLCNASFNQKSNLRSHMRIHTGERPVQCKVCGKGFSRNTHLKQHMKLHTGEKPYQCKVCHRPFRFKSGLQAHERIHTGLKPYACSLCGRTFTQIVGLIRHERTHAGEKPFRCQSCGKSFNTRDALKSHVMKHTGERPHTCDRCPKTFTDPSALRCHRKKYHSNMLICVICLREDFKDRIELREHLRAHERQNWEETPEGELIPLVRSPSETHFISVDDTLDGDEMLGGEDEVDENYPVQNEVAIDDRNHVEVELDPDDPMEDDSENGGLMDDRNDRDSDYDEHELHIEDSDPLA